MKKQPSVRLMMRIRIGQRKYRYVTPVMVDTKRGKKLKALYAKIDGKEEHHPEATYALRFQEHGKRIFENLGSDPDLALLNLDKKKRGLA
ncbi:MAG: hypothetical protein ACJ73N_04235, partial [Bryobacteraceae bacterium]